MKDSKILNTINNMNYNQSVFGYSFFGDFSEPVDFGREGFRVDEFRNGFSFLPL